MYKLKYDDLFAHEITNAYEYYDKEIEIKILLDFPNDEFLKEKYNLKKLDNYEEIYLLVTIDKKLKNITFLQTEITFTNGDTQTIYTNYDFEEKEIIRKIALQKIREEMFKKF